MPLPVLLLNGTPADQVTVRDLVALENLKKSKLALYSGTFPSIEELEKKLFTALKEKEELLVKKDEEERVRKETGLYSIFKPSEVALRAQHIIIDDIKNQVAVLVSRQETLVREMSRLDEQIALCKRNIVRRAEALEREIKAKARANAERMRVRIQSPTDRSSPASTPYKAVGRATIIDPYISGKDQQAAVAEYGDVLLIPRYPS